MLTIVDKTIHYIKNIRTLQQINIALSRAAATSSLRNLNLSNPISWEFSGFSQNGEDGIIDLLCSKITQPNRYFFEIGAADGLENNTSWLAIAKKYSGIMIEGNPKLAKRLAMLMGSFNLGVEVKNIFVTKNNINEMINLLLYSDPDLFSLDIDGNDYHILNAFLTAGLRPKVLALEYNSAFGPHKAITIPYNEDFNYLAAHVSGLYYGVAINAWIKLLTQFGYQFVTVDSNGVNAFFIDPNCFSQAFIRSLQPLMFTENFYQLKKYKGTSASQFDIIQHMNFEEV
jgi:hypothetical protein